MCIFCFSEQKLAATDPSSGFKFQSPKATRARDVACAASQLHDEDEFPMGRTHKRLLEIICECGGDRSAVIERHRAELKVTCRPCDSRTPEERREAMKKECEENVREWFRKKGIKVQSRDDPPAA